MSLTLSNQSFAVTGQKKITLVDLAFDSSYPTGGEALTPGQVGMSVIERVLFETDTGYLFQYDSANQKVKVFYGGGVDISPAFTGSEMGTHTHTISPWWNADQYGVSAPTIALTHNADPVTNLAAAALYVDESTTFGTKNALRLYSTTAANANVLGETADGAVYGAAASARFWVNDSDTPFGVPIYVNEAESDQLEFVSPTLEDGFILMPLETGYGFALSVTVHHNVDAANGKALYFDDNGAADAQLCFVDTGGTGGTIPSGDIAIVGPGYNSFEQSAAGTIDAITAGTPAGTITSFSAGAAEEVDNSTDLSALTGVKCVVIGY